MPLKLSRNAKLLSPARMWEELQMNLADAIENHGQSKNVLEELSWSIPGDAYPSLDDLGFELGNREPKEAMKDLARYSPELNYNPKEPQSQQKLLNLAPRETALALIRVLYPPQI